MLSAAALSLLFAFPQTPVSPNQDPERDPAGRSTFLGREVAQTMHWTGAAWLMRATREDEENGALLRRWLAIRPGQSVCDLGCGNGYHTIPIAQAVGERGKVYAVDLQPQMLTLLRLRSEKEELDNLQFLEATVDDPKLPANSCDTVLMVDVYHELSHPMRVMAHVRRALRPGGRVVLVEFRAEDPSVPIKPEHMMSKAQVVLEMAAHGFALADETDALPWQHAMAFEPARSRTRLGPRQVVRAFLKAQRGKDERIVRPFLAASLKTTDLPALPDRVQAELRAGPGGRILADLQPAAGTELLDARDQLVLRKDRNGRWRIEEARQAQPILRSHGSQRAFVAMHTALGRGTVDKRIELAERLDFDGVAWDLQQLAQAREACEARSVDLLSAYAVLDVDSDATERQTARVLSAMQSLAGGPGMLWLALRNGARKPGSAQGDTSAAAALAPILRQANSTGVEVALYPHTGFWLERTEDAIRLTALLDEPKLGICFNLCHFLRNHEGSDPRALLKRCGPRLFAVTVNGADRDGSNWRSLIQPLGQGDFDLTALLTNLDELAFAGPIGLQGYGIQTPTREHLSASMQAFRDAHR